MFVVMLGSNDIAENPHNAANQVSKLLEWVELVQGSLARRVAVVEVPIRTRFVKTNRDFRPEVNGHSQDWCEKYFVDCVQKFNKLLFDGLKPMANAFFLPLKGMHD